MYKAYILILQLDAINLFQSLNKKKKLFLSSSFVCLLAT